MRNTLALTARQMDLVLAAARSHDRRARLVGTIARSLTGRRITDTAVRLAIRSGMATLARPEPDQDAAA